MARRRSKSCTPRRHTDVAFLPQRPAVQDRGRGNQDLVVDRIPYCVNEESVAGDNRGSVSEVCGSIGGPAQGAKRLVHRRFAARREGVGGWGSPLSAARG